MRASPLTNAELEKLRAIRHVALDMDGTIYCGSRLFPETLPFLSALRAQGIGFSFLTNNSSKNTAEYLRHLQRFGIEAGAENLLTSAHVTLDLLKLHHPEVSRVFVLGTAGLRHEVSEAGYQVVSPECPGKPDAVIVGFDPAATYRDLCKAAFWVSKGIPYLATHPDAVCPTDQETILVDCGSVCAAIAHAVGRHPDRIGGKPEGHMMESLCLRHGVESFQVAMIGDRLHTDIAMARNSGAVGVLTLTGETHRDHVAESATKPDFVIENLHAFLELRAEAEGAVFEA